MVCKADHPADISGSVPASWEEANPISVEVISPTIYWGNGKDTTRKPQTRLAPNIPASSASQCVSFPQHQEKNFLGLGSNYFMSLIEPTGS